MSSAIANTEFSAIRVDVTSGVATVTIDNPPLNVLDAPLIQDLRRFVSSVRTDTEIHVIIFQSADPEFFIAHGDANFVTDPDLMAQASEGFEQGPLNFMQMLHESLRTLPQITIAKIAGYTRGGGLELAMSLDMRFAAIGLAKMSQPEALIDIAPGGGGSQYLTRLVGRARALEIILSGELVDAEVAERVGLINRALPADEIDVFVESLAQRIAGLAPGVVAAAVTAIDAAADLPTPEGLAVENAQLLALFTPAAAARSIDLLDRGLQTREGELALESILLAQR